MARTFFNEDFKEIFIAEILSVLGGLIAGSFLVYFTHKISLVLGLLIILPGFLEMRGCISGAMASRLSSGLFLGLINPKKPQKWIVRSNFMGAIFLSVIAALVLGLIAFSVNYFIFGILNYTIIFVALIAVLICDCIELPLTTISTLYFFKKGYDPNNIMGPFLTTVGDIFSVFSLFLVVAVIS